MRYILLRENDTITIELNQNGKISRATCKGEQICDVFQLLSPLLDEPKPRDFTINECNCACHFGKKKK